MKKIYLDNASTSFPKPNAVSDAVYEYMTSNGMNINRGAYANAYSTAEFVYETRELLCELFNADNPKNVVFTKNITESLNIVLKGLLKSGDHILVSDMEHNAMMRPLTQLKDKGVRFDRIPCDNQGNLLLEKVEDLINENTVAIAITHASNICGTILPIKEIGEICNKHNLKFIVDSAQTAGVIPIDMKNMNISALCFTGHKSLLGPQGTGGFILDEDMISKIEPLLSGGTGSVSHTEEIPNFMPDRFEAGTMNIPGIMGLRAALRWHKEHGDDSMLKHELNLTQKFIDALLPLEQCGLIRIVGRKDIKNRVSVVSIQTLKHDCAEIAFKLDNDFNIMTRVGMHCAPNAHKTLGTFPEGTIRFSFGYSTTEDEIDAAISALNVILKNNSEIAYYNS